MSFATIQCKQYIFDLACVAYVACVARIVSIFLRRVGIGIGVPMRMDLGKVTGTRIAIHIPHGVFAELVMYFA